MAEAEVVKLELQCAVYGDATVFPVTIARDAKVSALQKAIFHKKRYGQRFQFDASMLTLYLARKEDDHGESKWLKDDRDVKDFLRGDISAEYEEMRPTWELSDPELLGPDFQSGRKEIHVLVELPKVEVGDMEAFLVHHILTAAPSSTSSRSNVFKANLVEAYGCRDDGGKLRCMLLDTALPSQVVIASHLFRRSLAFLAEKLMDFSEIDDPRNGLLLFKPLEHAFDHFQISFLYDHASDNFYLKVFDRSLLNQPLVTGLDHNQFKILFPQPLPGNWEELDPILAPGTDFAIQTTFGDVDGRPIRFQTLARPFKRCLNLQARLAREEALKKKWIKPDEDEFPDFWSEGLSVEAKMEFYFAHTQPTPSDDTEQS